MKVRTHLYYAMPIPVQYYTLYFKQLYYMSLR